MTSHQDDPKAAAASVRSRVLIIGGIVPIAITIVATALMISWLPELPEPIAVHWNVSGANGFGPVLPFVIVPPVATALFSFFAVAWSRRSIVSGVMAWNQKVIVVASVWFAVLMNVAFAGSLWVQRGIADAHDAPDVGPTLLIGFTAAVVLGALAWFLLPPGRAVDAPGVAASPVSVAGGERVSWSHSTQLATTPLILISVVIGVAFATVIASVAVTPRWVLHGTITILVVSALAATNFWWRVSADTRGFIVKGFFGWPRKRIPLERITSVSVVDVNPSGDFGGWGWRWTADGRTGVILFTGPGIEVTQSNGKRFVVTVPDASTGAGVLAALVAKRSRS